MNDEFLLNVSLHGEKGKAWLDSIPNIIAIYEKQWSLQVGKPYILTYNYVAPVVLKNGTPAVIKIGMPWEKEFLNEIDALEVFNGDGISKLLRADRENFVMLLQQVQPGTPLSTIEDDDKATQILASLIKKMQKPLPTHNSFITIYEWTKELREYPKKKIKKVPAEIVQQGIALFENLLATSQTPVLTHGDLHHDNVLAQGTTDWLAIDPKGIAAEPLYDVAALIRNPYKKVKKLSSSEMESLFARRITILAQQLHADPKRIHQWCLAQTILSRVWTADVKEYTEHALKVINALQKIQF